MTNEKAYLLGKFARVALRTSQIDYNGRSCVSSAAAADLNRAALFGECGLKKYPVVADDSGQIVRSLEESVCGGTGGQVRSCG